MTLDFSVIADNWRFLLVQGLLGIGAFGGGTLALAVPTIILGFLLGVGVALGRLSSRAWLRRPATLYVELIRGVPLVMPFLTQRGGRGQRWVACAREGCDYRRDAESA